MRELRLRIIVLLGLYPICAGHVSHSAVLLF